MAVDAESASVAVLLNIDICGNFVLYAASPNLALYMYMYVITVLSTSARTHLYTPYTTHYIHTHIYSSLR